MTAPPDRYVLLLGSNVEREENLENATRMLEARFEILARSRVVESDAVGDPTGPRFLNRALLVRSSLRSGDMHRALHAIEMALGRLRTLDRNSPRTIDIDMMLALDASGAVLPDPPPHRDLRRHHYAALPCAEVAGGAPLPEGATLAEAAAALGPPPPGLRVLAGP